MRHRTKRLQSGVPTLMKAIYECKENEEENSKLLLFFVMCIPLPQEELGSTATNPFCISCRTHRLIKVILTNKTMKQTATKIILISKSLL